MVSRQLIQSEHAPAPVAKYAQAVLCNGLLFVQGMIGLDPKTGKLVDGGVESQTFQVFRSIEAILHEAGMTVADLVKITVFLADLSDYPRFNALYNAWVNPQTPPARTTVEAKMPLDARIEIECIAAKS